MRILLVVVGAWLAWTALAFLLQRRLLYPGTAMEPYRPLDADALAGVERIWVEHEGGRVEAWLLPASDPEASPPSPAPALVWFHGNGEFIDDWVDLLRPFPDELGVSLLLVEYPGYGRSTGRPSEERINEVARDAWDALAARPGVDRERMVAFGRSLGGGPAAMLARERAPVALILQSAFTDVADIAVPRFWVPPFLVRDRFPTLEAVRDFAGPVLVLHGRNDGLIPFSHAERLAAVGDHVTLHPLACGHNDCPPPGAAWWAAIRGFLEEAGVLEAG